MLRNGLTGGIGSQGPVRLHVPQSIEELGGIDLDRLVV
jgi:hypothetical protein